MKKKRKQIIYNKERKKERKKKERKKETMFM